MTYTKHLSVRITQEMHTRLNKLAQDRGCKMSRVAKDLLEKALENKIRPLGDPELVEKMRKSLKNTKWSTGETGPLIDQLEPEQREVIENELDGAFDFGE